MAIGRIFSAIGSAVILSGCTQYIVIDPALIPARPVLPAVASSELSCLSPQAYKRLLAREQARRVYAEQLEALIQ